MEEQAALTDMEEMNSQDSRAGWLWAVTAQGAGLSDWQGIQTEV